MRSYVASVVACLAASAAGHSWIECTDYRMAAPDQPWDPTLCKGRPRCSERQTAAGFGVDTGMNIEKKQCQCAYGSDAGKAIPTATYTPGQRVCLAYPPKTHVADTCTGAFIPDQETIISRTALGATTDDFSGKTYEHLNGKHVDGTIDHKGFQNCQNFCADKDKALCTMCFDLEADIAPGKYSFKWDGRGATPVAAVATTAAPPVPVASSNSTPVTSAVPAAPSPQPSTSLAPNATPSTTSRACEHLKQAALAMQCPAI
ncbi:hypothetical protein SPRG_02344 [Saprolegnia parasitica CBS 223.65]|uniref:Chitin-binding type-4 domain-containing protein n=1 Tax=Saprolegnia parasitica (strain CBS 223.65) TaxID=695850 RepID=A0A067CQ70_SAPPC|nr:hypothetical protein SPRG_02344 [Saprolegnia parasitica CBS 223.65]KDO32643.1 hypothetical protein SPRG_02344 [Saprolegnia parasitica CBS 223.65]|eukprot:XP_012196310.1 hypothetical protein SPRG_02344 [Saprolegnia parasitica CBS 223.65]